MILAGRLDKLFPSENIRFDTEHGSYYPLVHSRTPITLTAADPTLLHWGINLLNRNGERSDLIELCVLNFVESDEQAISILGYCLSHGVA